MRSKRTLCACGAPRLPHVGAKQCATCRTKESRHTSASVASASSVSHVTHYAAGDPWVRHERTLCAPDPQTGERPTKADKAAERRATEVQRYAGTTTGAISATISRTYRVRARRSRKGLVTRYRAPGPDAPVRPAQPGLVLTAGERKAERFRTVIAVAHGVGAETTAREMFDSDPHEGRCKLAEIAIDTTGSPYTAMGAAYSARARGILASTAGAYVRARAMGADKQTAMGAARTRVHDGAWCPQGVRTPTGGKARLDSGRTGSPWHTGQGAQWAGLKGRKRTADAGDACGSAGRRQRAKGQQRAGIACDTMDRAADWSGPVERVRKAAADLARAITQGAPRSHKRALRATLHRAAMSAGVCPRRALRAAIDDRRPTRPPC